MIKQRVIANTISLAFLLISPLAMAVTPKYEISISGHTFSPSEIIIPANTKVRLLVHNKDDSPEEFHSDSLHREKIISPNATGKINIGPLTPGIYTFMGEFHMRTAQGRIIVK